MSKSVEDCEVSELEKQVIIKIEEELGYKFEILDIDEFFYALPPSFYSILIPKYGWPPTDDIFDKYDDLDVKSHLAIVIESNPVIGLSIIFHPKLLPIDISQLPKSFENL
ncbi:MAG: hypothetical protein ACXADW_16140 [Candidatus Hodarchaeales archaeon]